MAECTRIEMVHSNSNTIGKLAQKKAVGKRSSLKTRSKNEKFLFVARKHVLLAIVSVASTLMAMLAMAVFSIPVVWCGLDYVVNVLCILMMFSWNKKYYVKKRLLRSTGCVA